MQNIFFFQTQQIHDNTNLFDQFKKQNISYSYFQVNQNYYLFFYRQTPIDLHFLYQSVDVIQELDFKIRKIRSFRGFILYALEIIKTAKDYQILQTNLQPFFWKKVKDIIRQNKKGALLEFLFGYDSSRKEDGKLVDEGSNLRIKILEDQIENLQNQVTLLQQKVINLEAKLGNSKYPLRDPSHPSESSKTIQQDHYTFEAEKGPYLTSNDPKRSALLSEVRNPTSQTKDIQSKNLSDHSKIDFKASETSEQ